MKLKIPAWRVARPYLIFGAILGVFFYLIPGFAFPPTPAHYFIMGVWLVTTIGYIVIGILTSFYIIEKDGIVQRRFNQVMRFRYEEIVYVDEAYTAKKKTLRFITDTGDIRYLLLDKEGKIHAEIVKHAKLITPEECSRRFPNIKI